MSSKKALSLLSVSPSKKNRINLEDYDYKRDIQNRILMSTFTTFDLEVMEELLQSSIIIDIAQMAENLNSSLEELFPVLEKLQKTELFQIKEDKLYIDKEQRKYFESQILKFDNHFVCGMDFLQGLLKKVPIQILPTWYPIPRSSDNIFESIAEKYLLTPSIFKRYINDLEFSDERLTQIVYDVFTAPNFKVNSQDIRNKYQLSIEEFEYLMLHLEFNFLCCLSYNEDKGQWQEVITPFHEWREFLRYKKDHFPQQLNAAKIEKKVWDELSFSKGISVILQSHKLGVDPEALEKGTYLLTPASCSHLKKENPILETVSDEKIQQEFAPIVYRLEKIRLITIQKEGKIKPSTDATTWITMSDADRAVAVIRSPYHALKNSAFHSINYTERNIRDIETTIAELPAHQWFLVEQFIAYLTCGIGTAHPTTLSQKGRFWKYEIPMYTEEQRGFVQAIMQERFYESGLISIGTYENKLAFKLTSFGQEHIGHERC